MLTELFTDARLPWSKHPHDSAERLDGSILVVPATRLPAGPRCRCVRAG